ncbi:MAG: response regulator, partial [Methylococcales bacterium]|nr:response regulator [Methylococcales bacterium]
MFTNKKLSNLSFARVLYIEDDLDTREALQFTLENYVAELYLAKNGREGLDLYREHLPDIVVTDIQMPEMNGLAMATEIRALNPEQAIVILSAHDDAEYLFRTLVRVSKVLSLAFKSPKHEIYHGNMNESGARFGQHFVILA